VLGVYYNDSGIEPPGAGQFIAWDKFLKLWQNNFVEIR
jgi:hypothetical protein